MTKEEFTERWVETHNDEWLAEFMQEHQTEAQQLAVQEAVTIYEAWNRIFIRHCGEYVTDTVFEIPDDRYYEHWLEKLYPESLDRFLQENLEVARALAISESISEYEAMDRLIFRVWWPVVDKLSDEGLLQFNEEGNLMPVHLSY